MRFKQLILIFLLFGTNTYAFPPGKTRNNNSPVQKLAPDHFRIQFAGNIGVLSAGIGKTHFNSKLTSNLMIGYVPPFIGKTAIISIAQKNTFYFTLLKRKKLERLKLTAGLTLNFDTGRNSFVSLPERYPKGYYGSNAFTFILHSGITWEGKIHQKNKIKQINYNLEVGSLATDLFYNYKRKDYFNPDALSLALAINLKI